MARPVEWRNPEPRRPDDAWRELLHRRSAIPGLDYELAPDRDIVAHGARVRTNHLGMRDDEPLPVTADALRIAAIGDSFTFGWGLPAERVWPQRLEALLAADPAFAGRPVDVLNFGVSGYSTVHEVALVEHRVLAFKPDAIVLGYFLNDPETEPVQPLAAYFARPRWWQRSHLLRLAAQAANRRAIDRLGGGDYYRYVHHDPRRWGSVVSSFGRLRELAGPTMPVIVVIFPEPRLRDWDTYPYGDLHHRVAGAAGEAGLDVVDLLGVFSAWPPERIRLARTDPHPTPLGHDLAARAIADRLRDRQAVRAPVR